MANGIPRGRIQIVLVPGFAGFDALGQLHYYADVTPVFREWAGKANVHAQPVLHYFDNLPTAGVTARAARLRDWLAKRIARGELQREDRIALVGHSTGGLDIRQLVWDLALRPNEEIPVDGAKGAAYAVRAGELLELVKRIVFLSVPQWGTNIADWVRAHDAHGLLRKAIVAELLGTFALRSLPLADHLETWVARGALSWEQPEVFLAFRDAVTEMDPGSSDDAKQVVAAQEARGEIELWLRHMWSDFSAIEDLCSTPRGDNTTPARFDGERRMAETGIWARHGITSRSYATVGSRPFGFEHGKPAPQWRVTKPWSWADVDGHGDAASKTDRAYRLCYRACAGGPFVIPGGGSTATATRFDTRELAELEVWDNDGIVNTASMLWPEGSDTRLLLGDHGDIVGHFRLVEAVRANGRRFHTYDLLASGAGFDEQTFTALWRDVFDFCIG